MNETSQYQLLKSESQVHLLKFIAMSINVVVNCVIYYIFFREFPVICVMFASMVYGFLAKVAYDDLSAYLRKRAEMKILVLRAMENFSKSVDAVTSHKFN
jgi:positive regulator of sigma E activity